MKFTISARQIYDIFPNPNFTLEREFCEFDEKKVEPFRNPQKTKEFWSACSDVSVRERFKEIVYRNRYRIILFSYPNSDLTLLACSESVLLTPEIGDPFYISDIEIKVTNDKDAVFTYEMEYSKDEPNVVICPLRSDNIEKTAGINKNRIRVVNNKPAYAQRTTLEFSIPYNCYVFQFVLNDLTANINVGDQYAFHLQNYDISLYSEGIALCTVKTATYLEFRLIATTITDIDRITDFVKLDTIFENIISTAIFTPLTYDIYTLINPKFGIKKTLGEPIKGGDNIEKSATISFYDYIRAPFLLHLSQLWKYKFLCTASNVEFYFNNVLRYTATTNFEIADSVDNDFYEQMEFELIMQIENLTLKNT